MLYASVSFIRYRRHRNIPILIHPLWLAVSEIRWTFLCAAENVDGSVMFALFVESPTRLSLKCLCSRDDSMGNAHLEAAKLVRRLARNNTMMSVVMVKPRQKRLQVVRL